MRGHNICFHSEIRKNVFELSSVPSLIWSSISSLDKETLSKGVLTLKGKNSFPLRVEPIEKGDKNEDGRVAFPEAIFIHLKTYFLKMWHCLGLSRLLQTPFLFLYDKHRGYRPGPGCSKHH